MTLVSMNGLQPPLEILHVAVPEETATEAWNLAQGLLPSVMLAEAGRYRRAGDLAAALCARLLLRLMAERMGHADALATFRRDARGRPAVDAPFDFSLSHTRGMAVCAAGRGLRVGIDVERAARIDLAEHDWVLSAAERGAVRTAADPLRAFYRLWTVKESVLKADGAGLGAEPSEVLVGEGEAFLRGRRWYFREPAVHADYACAVACDRAEAVAGLNVRGMTLAELAGRASAGG